jgi:hypothetical protein
MEVNDKKIKKSIVLVYADWLISLKNEDDEVSL